MMRTFFLSFLALVLLSGCSGHRGSVEDAVSRQLEDYPQSAMQDIYKSFYQDRFGAEHMITDTAAVREYLLYELEIAADDTVSNPYYESVGAEGRYIRVYLRCVNEGLLTAEQLLDAFVRSAVPAEKPRQSWADEWQIIMRTARKAGVECTEEESRLLMKAARDNRAVHHSDAYRNAYHPHYRIVERTIFEKEIK